MIRSSASWKRKPVWLLLLVILLAVIALFVELLGRQNDFYNPNLLKARMLESGDLVPLDQWSFRFQKCRFNKQPVKCDHLSLEPENIRIPDLSAIKKTLAEKYPTANVAIGVHELSPKSLSWLQKNPDALVAFVVPTSVQSRLFLLVGRARFEAAGVGSHMLVYLPARSLLAEKQVILEYEFHGLDWFGPIDLPPALSKLQNAGGYLALRERQIGSANLVRQIQIGFPMIIAAIALVLDHSIAFSLLSLFGFSQAVSSFLNFLSDSGVRLAQHWTYISFGVNGFAFVAVLLVVLELAEVRILKQRTKVILAIGFFLLFGLVGFLGSEWVVKIDAYSESAACLIGLGVILYGYWLVFVERKQKIVSHLPSEQEHTMLSSALKVIRLSVAACGLTIHAYVNMRDIFLIEQIGFREMLDWRHNILFPSLTAACLLEVGSTSRKMFRFSREMVSKALIERELEVGKAIQQRMLPDRKSNKAGWAWRSVYLPATHLAGDWYDLRAVRFKSGEEYLVACLADVTGHGVGAALATSVISSHWGLWCAGLERLDAPRSDDGAVGLLESAPERINEGLLALRKNENCTAVFCLLHRASRKVHLVSAGHPGAFVSNGRSLAYFTSRGERLGVLPFVRRNSSPKAQEAADTGAWAGVSRTLEESESLILYSDGIVPVGKTVSGWAAGLKRELRDAKSGGINASLMRQLKENRRAFRIARNIEDDMTVVIISPDPSYDGELRPITEMNVR